MSNMPLPLPIWPWAPSPERVQLIVEALRRIDTPIKLIPVQGGPMGTDRILCFGSLPPYLCRTIPIAPANVDSVDSIEKALRYFLDPWRDESHWNEDFQLGVWMGAEVKLSHVEDETGRVVFNA